MSGRILIFAGAGASAAIDPERYPTTSRFFELLPGAVTGSPVYSILVRYLNDVRRVRRVDVEHLLWTMGELDDFLAHVSDESRLPHWLLSNGKFAELVGKSSDLRPTVSLGRQIHPALINLRDRINEQVYDLYASPPMPAELAATWLPLLEGALGLESHVELFTTNYDLILEYAIEEGKLPISSGRIPSPLRPKLDVDAWNDLETRERGLLTKLHGSVDWSRHTDDILVGNSLYKGDHRKHVIIYPGFKGAPAAEPFLSFHRHFERVARAAVAAIFVGFGFRDDYINEVLNSSLSPDTPVLVINPEEDLSMPFASSTKLHRLEKGFGRESSTYAAGWLLDSIRAI
jgi:hypothetical protein